jgi:CubicO group peptidase (beta-lactamase class C family)
VSRAALGLLLLAARAAAAAGACPPRDGWPDPDWPVEAERVRTARAAEVAALERYAFTLEGSDAERKGVRTDGVVVVHRGVVTYERYGRGFGPATRHLGWSVSKSVTSALVGAAVAARALAVGDSICDHLGRGAGHCGITVRNLLEFASGLDWRETYEGRAHQDSSVLAMLYGVGRHDMARFVLGHRPRAAPGAQWAYSSGDALLLAAVAGAAMEPRHGRDWPWTRLFDPVGMRSAAIERDTAGTLVGSSHFFATPRDLARFGYLYLNDGCWQGRRVLPDGWVRRSTSVSEVLRAGSPHRHPGDVQGWALWLNRAVPELGQPVPWPEVPDDAYFMRGHWGQLVAVVPSLDLVVVRTGDDRDESAFEIGRFTALAAAAGRLP